MRSRPLLSSLGLHRFGPVVRTPGAHRLLLATFVGKTGSLGIMLAILLATHDATGSFGVAGTATGALTAGIALGRVAQGRLIDRRGGRPVLLASAALMTLGAAGLIAALAAHAAAIPLVALSGVLGCALPSSDTLTRMLWSALVPDAEERSRAYALDGMIVELAGIAGPGGAAVCATAISAAFTLGALTCFAVAGAAMVALAPTTRLLPSRPPSAGRGRSPARQLVALLTVMLGIGLVAGCVSTAVPAFAIERGARAAIGPLFLGLAAGTISGGLWYGSRVWRIGVERRLLAAALVLGATCVGLSAAPTTASLGVLLVAFGLPLPALITATYMLVDGRVPAEQRGEAFALITSASASGYALGSVVSGWAIAFGSARSALLLAVVLSAITLAAAARLMRTAPAAVPA